MLCKHCAMRDRAGKQSWQALPTEYVATINQHVRGNHMFENWCPVIVEAADGEQSVLHIDPLHIRQVRARVRQELCDVQEKRARMLRRINALRAELPKAEPSVSSERLTKELREAEVRSREPLVRPLPAGTQHLLVFVETSAHMVQMDLVCQHLRTELPKEMEAAGVSMLTLVMVGDSSRKTAGPKLEVEIAKPLSKEGLQAFEAWLDRLCDAQSAEVAARAKRKTKGTKIAPMAASLVPVASLTWQCQGPPPPRAWVKARQLRRAITADALAETQEITGCVALHHRPKRSLSLHVLAHASIRKISKTGRGAAMFVLCSPPADAEECEVLLRRSECSSQFDRPWDHLTICLFTLQIAGVLGGCPQVCSKSEEQTSFYHGRDEDPEICFERLVKVAAAGETYWTAFAVDLALLPHGPTLGIGSFSACAWAAQAVSAEGQRQQVICRLADCLLPGSEDPRSLFSRGIEVLGLSLSAWPPVMGQPQRAAAPEICRGLHEALGFRRGPDGCDSDGEGYWRFLCERLAEETEVYVPPLAGVSASYRCLIKELYSLSMKDIRRAAAMAYAQRDGLASSDITSGLHDVEAEEFKIGVAARLRPADAKDASEEEGVVLPLHQKATTVSIASEDVPEEQAEQGPVEYLARNRIRNYSKSVHLQSKMKTSFVRDDADELDGTDTWRYYALVAEKEVENSKLVEAQLAEGSEAAPQPSLTYLSHTVCDAIEQGIICKEDFPRAILEDKHSKYNASKAKIEMLTEQLGNARHITAHKDELNQRGHGGDVLKFSGDALTILWRVEDEGTLPPVSKADATSRQVAELVEAAVVPISGLYSTCHTAIHRQSSSRKVGAKKSRSSFGATPVPGVVLTLHVGVGFGPLTLLQLGGVLDRWEFCAAGQPLEEVAIAEPLAHSGETVVSPSVQEVLASKGQNSEFCFEAFSWAICRPAFRSSPATPSSPPLLLRSGVERQQAMD
ncbi:unnamed protein product [Symbiodinium necroappetens]|uniref:Uncharacterized protein n=1 Tax=Symbiodinium necroappetens TaxID=1628268 RepID=A0A812M5W9_9DINO|nr:unnamed protein product [Symbiodinium necroappetens]